MHWFGFRSAVNLEPISKMYEMRLYDETFAGTSHNLNLIADNEIVSAMANGTVEWVMQSAIIIISIRSLGTRDTFHTTHTHIGHQKTAARQAFAFGKMIMCRQLDKYMVRSIPFWFNGFVLCPISNSIPQHSNTQIHTHMHARTDTCMHREWATHISTKMASRPGFSDTSSSLMLNV